jgi:hypothetical protein
MIETLEMAIEALNWSIDYDLHGNPAEEKDVFAAKAVDALECLIEQLKKGEK